MHTASTAAGAVVAGANMDLPMVLLMYKICFQGRYADSDLFPGMESAIEDGVDILSISMGGGNAPYYEDVIARGTSAAMKRAIFVACSAGNMGPRAYTVQNTAPWVATVGARSIDQAFPVKIMLGNGKSFIGSSLSNALGIGAGHINPSLAADPGLIYDANGSDYTNFLFSLNYTIPDEVICAGTPANLNYPSFSVVFKHNNCIQEVKRTLTNEGATLPQKYTFKNFNPRSDWVAITVHPQNL
ncbi:unnamed protein product [Ilex paraguariensis]|uniref:Peptidase S8/S53 domain-containing protein n=1 Tax=Ilex paraguariensis TaxID=185542 RepID=A0ABC8SIX8_9AQUA